MLGLLVGAGNDNASTSRSILRRQPLEFQRREHARILAIAKFGLARRVVGVVAGGNDDRADLERQFLFLLGEIDSTLGAS